jgi:ABC-type uncharacterized transport system auxiliary subunit
MTLRRLVQLAITLPFLGFCFSCGGARPIKYYVIDTEPAPVQEAPAPSSSVVLMVARITSSHLYRDDRIVYGSGPVELGTYEYQRWAAPPADMLQDDLISSLRATGQYRSVSKVGSTIRGDYILRGQLYALDEVDKPTLAARFSFRLELFDPKSGATVWADSYVHDEPVNGKQMADVVEAMDHNVRTGLAQLTSRLGQYLASHPASNVSH